MISSETSKLALDQFDLQFIKKPSHLPFGIAELIGQGPGLCTGYPRFGCLFSDGIYQFISLKIFILHSLDPFQVLKDLAKSASPSVGKKSLDLLIRIKSFNITNDIESFRPT